LPENVYVNAVPYQKLRFIWKTSVAPDPFLLQQSNPDCFKSNMNSVNHRVVVHLRDQIGIIKPELHGHFLEHLGSATYGGMWVGEDSPIPNIKGFRKTAVEHLQDLGISVLRWPGGCFADDYHWRDGIGPPATRPKRVNIWWGDSIEDNSFGTHEFMELCRLLNAQPYLAGNVGSGTPQEFRDWVEYCNQHSRSTLSDERRTNGSPEPFRVKYWGVGNESWACGGHMTPEEYASLYVRFATYVHAFDGLQPYLIAVGPESNTHTWTKRFFTALRERQFPLRPSGFAMHYYSWGKSSATSYTFETMREQLASFTSMERAIQEQRALVDRYAPEDGNNRRVDLLVDEWGTWNIDPQDERTFGRLWQQNTMKDALAAALGLNVFHRNADSLSMCNLAQLVNVLQAPLLAHESECIRTPTYYALKMCGIHKGGMSARVEHHPDNPTDFSVSASRQQEDVALTLVNSKHDVAINVECVFPEVGLSSATAEMLHHLDLNACNTFVEPNVIRPRECAVDVDSAGCVVHLPPLSIVTIKGRMTQSKT
jgi:alpha-L-arabinofuranosidase